MKTRSAAVAGTFYPADAKELKTVVNAYLDDQKALYEQPKAIIAPHAGYIYSGPIAASAYRQLETGVDTIQRVVLLGPAHRVSLFGLATSSADNFITPLGSVPVDREAIEKINSLPQVRQVDEAHALEHSLEVHLPFLQLCLKTFSLVPLVVGESTPEEVAEVLERLWGSAETLIIISSDLSHYHDYATAKSLDEKLSKAVENLHIEAIKAEAACGSIAIKGLLKVAANRGLSVQTIDLRNSGDTAGSHDAVVGYGAYLFHEH